MGLRAAHLREDLFEHGDQVLEIEPKMLLEP